MACRQTALWVTAAGPSSLTQLQMAQLQAQYLQHQQQMQQQQQQGQGPPPPLPPPGAAGLMRDSSGGSFMGGLPSGDYSNMGSGNYGNLGELNGLGGRLPSLPGPDLNLPDLNMPDVNGLRDMPAMQVCPDRTIGVGRSELIKSCTSHSNLHACSAGTQSMHRPSTRDTHGFVRAAWHLHI